MKNIIKLLAVVLIAAFVGTASAQPASGETFIKGDIVIRFDTRTQLDGDKPKADVTDKYRLNLNVADSVVFEGTIESRPFIKNKFSSNQTGALTHAIECFVLNPKNISQRRNIGRLYGEVPVDEQNVYRFEDGSLRIGIFGAGGATGFESKVRGYARGKPPANSEGFLSKTKKDILKIGRSVAGGSTVTLAVTKYDQMTFENHILSAGPVMIYPEVTVNGPMVYDYDRIAWYFNGVTVTYSVEGRLLADKISGNIRWVESADRTTSGKGEYQFDIRLNEKPPSEASVFAGAADEAAFFATDNTIPGLVGTMKYKDTIINDVVTASVVTVDLKGNQLTKQQVVYLCKLLMMSSVVPLNSE